MEQAERHEIPAPQQRGQRLLAGTFRTTMKTLIKPMSHPRIPASLLRAGMRLLTTSTLRAAGVRFQPLRLGSVPGEMATPAKHGNQAVLYMHGGSYSVGSPATHRAITSHLAKSAHASVFAIDYRLAPEHVFPAATDDALEAYRWLLDNGYAGKDIFITGDSAGGGLALATAIQIRDLALPAPGGLMLLSPWLDLTSGALDNSTHIDDAMLSQKTLEHYAALYAGAQRDHALVSPLHANLHDLPATLLIVGTEEILLEQAEHLYQQLAATGSKVRLSVYQEMWHVFPVQVGLLATADAAINEMAAWMSR